MTTRQQLMEEREKLKRKLSEVEKQISNFDAEVYGGKMKKAIILLGECLNYLHCPTIPLNCPDCESPIDIDLDEVIDGLQALYRREEF